MTQESISTAIASVRARIAAAALTVSRDPSDVALLLATKTVPPERIREALGVGVTLIGENRVQELMDKAAALAEVPHEAHFIGHLQKNKINQVLRYASCIQSIDSVTLAEQVGSRVPADRSPFDVFVQVNTSQEDSKYGCDPSDAQGLVDHIGGISALRLRGFMTIGLFSADSAAVRESYRRLRQIRDEVVSRGNVGAQDACELSMGMSGDLELAIQEGATMVRVGSAVFGTRSTSDSYYWPESSTEA